MADNRENIVGKGKPFVAGKEQSEIARKGAAASAKVRAQKRMAKDIFSDVLKSQPDFGADTKKTLKKLGFDENADVTVMTVAAYAVAQKAMKGDVKALNFMLESAGETFAQWMQLQKFEMEKERLAMEKKRMEMLNPESEDGVAKSNQQILALFDLMTNPIENRGERFGVKPPTPTFKPEEDGDGE